MRKLRLSNLLPLAVLVVSGAVAASATTVATGGGSGTYTYNFNMPNGASFLLVTSGGAFGQAGSNITNFNYVGSPAIGYAPVNYVDSSGNSTYTVSGNSSTTDGGFDDELLLQYNSVVSGYANRLNYYFTEPVSFFERTGVDLPFTTGSGKYIFGPTGQSGPNFPEDLTYGEIAEGATYVFTNDADPGCASCTVTTTFTPAVVGATPEPSSVALLSTGVAAAFGMYRRRRASL